MKATPKGFGYQYGLNKSKILVLLILLSFIFSPFNFILIANAQTPTVGVGQENQTEEKPVTDYVPRTKDGELIDLWVNDKGVMYVKGVEAPWYDDEGVMKQHMPIAKGYEIEVKPSPAVPPAEEVAHKRVAQEKLLLESKRIERLEDEAKIAEKERSNFYQEQGLEDEDRPYVMGQLLVKYDDETYRKRTEYFKKDRIVLPRHDRRVDLDELEKDIYTVEKFFARNGLKDRVVVKDRLGGMKVEMFDFGRDADPITMIDLLKINPPKGVIYAQPSFKYELASATASSTPNDEFRDVSWHLKAIQAYDAWQVVEDNLPTNTATVTVGVIDNGVDFSNPDLASKKWAPVNNTCVIENSNGSGTTTAICDKGGYDFVEGDNDPTPHASSTHGTNVSSVITAEMDNNYRTIGVAPEGVEIVGLKAFGHDDEIASGTEYSLSLIHISEPTRPY